MIQWLIDNKNWLFSGLGIPILSYIFGFFSSYVINSSKSDISLSESDILLKEVINSSEYPMYIINEDFKTEIVNKRYADLLHTSMENVKGRDVSWSINEMEKYIHKDELEKYKKEQDDLYAKATKYKYPVASAFYRLDFSNHPNSAFKVYDFMFIHLDLLHNASNKNQKKYFGFIVLDRLERIGH